MFQLSIYYEEVSYNAIDYSNPIFTYMKVKSYLIDPNFCKIENLFFQEVIVSTDSGVIGENINNNSLQRIESTENRFYTAKANEECIITTRLFTSEDTQYNKRTYMKIPQILVQCSAVFNMILSLFQLFTTKIYKKIMKEIVMNKVFDVRMNDNLEPKKKTLALRKRLILSHNYI